MANLGIVWEDKLDKSYDCKVVRIKPYEGLLSVSKEGKELFKQDVTLSYDSRFGPDMYDVAEWQNICANFIDRGKDPVAQPGQST